MLSTVLCSVMYLLVSRQQVCVCTHCEHRDNEGYEMKRRLESNRTPEFMNLFIIFRHDIRVVIVVHRILNFQIILGELYLYLYFTVVADL